MRRAGAFTLVEVMMAVGVLALALTTAITTMQRAFLDLDTARNLQLANGIMQCELEKERLFTWAQVSDAAYSCRIDASFLHNPIVASRFTLVRATAVVAGHSGKMLQVTLTATWRSYDGHRLSRSFTTYFSQDGLNTYVYQNV